MDAYYEQCWVERFRAGHNPTSRAMHFGLYGDASGLRSDEEAKLATNELVYRMCVDGGAGSGSWADLGCGVGGTAAYVAALAPDTTVSAVDVGAAQIAHARSWCHLPNVRFHHASYAALPFPDASHEAAWMIESFCHASQRPSVLSEVARVLAPGGTLVIVDLFRTERITDESLEATYRRACAGFAVTDYYDVSLGRLLPAAGFVECRFADLGERAGPALLRTRDRAMARGTAARGALERAHDWTCMALPELIEKGVLTYGVWSAKKR